jgi:hypothetical protein
VGLKLIFLVVSRFMSLIRLSHRESWWKDAEILMLRHQLAVAQRQRPQVHARLTGILALGFFTVDLLNGTKIYVLAVIEHGIRRIRVLGASTSYTSASAQSSRRKFPDRIGQDAPCFTLREFAAPGKDGGTGVIRGNRAG